MSDPWMKWYPSAWLSDPCLRSCSLAARGLWVEMLCVMHESPRRGYLFTGNSAPTSKQLAFIFGISVKETNRLLTELLDAGVYSVEDGIIYSRRMVRDEKKRAVDRENGSKGGNPNLKAGVNPPDNGGDKAKILEARKERKKEQIPADAGSASVSSATKTYAFECGVIRLNAKDFEQWREAFSHLDLRAELVAAADWAGEQANWFHACKALLAKRNREAKTKTDALNAAGGFQWNGPEGVI